MSGLYRIHCSVYPPNHIWRWMLIQGVNALPTKWNTIFFPRNHLTCPELMQSSNFLSQNLLYKKRKINLPCLTLKAQDASLLLWVTREVETSLTFSPIACSNCSEPLVRESWNVWLLFPDYFRNDRHCSFLLIHPTSRMGYIPNTNVNLFVEPCTDLIKHL